MFGFANALLLALFAAAGVDLVLALRCKAVGQLFTVPHYLFGDWGGEARARWAYGRAAVNGLPCCVHQRKAVAFGTDAAASS